MIKNWQSVEISDQQRINYCGQRGTLACWQWAVDQFGSPGHRWQWNTQRTFLFRDSADAVVFALRWA